MSSNPLPLGPVAASPGRPKDMEKRAAILDSAMLLFPSRGYDGVTMDLIAQTAGVSKLTVYNHFADKESLFAAAVTECCAQLLPHQLFVPDPSLPVADALFHIAWSDEFHVAKDQRDSATPHKDAADPLMDEDEII